VLTIQIIRIQWPPEAHNPACATLRNRLPRVLPLPPAWLDCAFGGIHRQGFAARGGRFHDGGSRFKPLAALPPKTDGLHFVEEKQTLKVCFDDETGMYGLPRRTRRRLFALARGQTAQVRINGRFHIGFDDDVLYRQYTCNIAYYPHGDGRLFANKPFDCSVSLEEVLF
jgi:hypothetical protein